MTIDVEPLIQDLVDRIATADPLVATELGLTSGLDRLPSYSPAAVSAYVAAVRDTLPGLEAAAADADTATAIDGGIGLLVARRIVRDLEARGVQHSDPNLYLEATYGILLTMVKELGTPGERVDALRGRLLALPGLLEEGRDNLTGAVPRAFVDLALDSGPGVCQLVGEAVCDFAREAGREGALDEASRAAVAAVERFTAFLSHDVLPQAVSDCACGREILEQIITGEHMLDETPELIASVGRAIMDETRAAMDEAAAVMGFASADEAVTAVQADHPGAIDLLRSYRDALAAARRFVIDHDLVTLPDSEDCVVAPTPAFLRAALPFAAYEGPGPYDRELKGMYWVTEPAAGLAPDALDAALGAHPFASMPTVGVHEAYPGHHTQIVRAAGAPTLARRIAHIPHGGTLLCEGWAFYCEEMMARQGFLADPRVRLMRLNDQLWRACRVVIDAEVHVGAMSFDAAVELLAHEAHLTSHDAVAEVRWYVRAPGDPMSYLLGKREILALAADYARRRTAALKVFHDELLEWGAAPPALIRRGMGLDDPRA